MFCEGKMLYVGKDVLAQPGDRVMLSQEGSAWCQQRYPVHLSFPSPFSHVSTLSLHSAMDDWLHIIGKRACNGMVFNICICMNGLCKIMHMRACMRTSARGHVKCCERYALKNVLGLLGYHFGRWAGLVF